MPQDKNTAYQKKIALTEQKYILSKLTKVSKIICQ